MPKISIFDIESLFDDPPVQTTLIPLGTYTHPLPCVSCGEMTETLYTNPAVPLCETCATNAAARLTHWERETLRYETMLRNWCARFEAQRAAAPPDVQTRYSTLQEKICDSVIDPALYARLQTVIDREIAADGAMGKLLAAMRYADGVAVKTSAALDHCRLAQSALLVCKAAVGWSIPDDVDAARRVLYADPPVEDTAAVIRTMRQEALL